MGSFGSVHSLFRSPGVDRASSHFPRHTVLGQFDSFSGEMVLKSLFINNLQEALGSAHSMFRSLGDRALHLYSSFSGQMVLKRHVVVKWGKSLFICSGLLRDRVSPGNTELNKAIGLYSEDSLLMAVLCNIT